jgi:hypothetical protein
MKLKLSIAAFAEIIQAEMLGSNEPIFIREVAYDTRKIVRTEGVVFFGLKGAKQSGLAYIESAYDQGVRNFVVEEQPQKPHPEANYFMVKDALLALQKLAAFHRQNIKYPIVAITGSIGKTTVKEWIAHHLNLGFDHVYIFDHKSKVPIKSLLKPNTSVTIERIDYNRELLKFHLMMKARDIALNKYEWMLYLDADEFLIIDKDVHEFMEQYAKYNQVSFNWLVFGNNYLSHEPQGMLMENYTRCSVYASKLIKSFVRPPSIISVITPHVFNTKNMNLSVSGITMKPLNEDGSAQYNINKRYNQLTAYIAHYMYQSYDVYSLEF